MMRANHPLIALILCALPLAAASAQQSSAQATAPGAQAASPARVMPRPDELEPAVNTHAASTEPADATAAPASAPAGVGPAQTRSDAGRASAAASRAASKQTTAPRNTRKGPDRLQLDTTEITGNRELPKVLFIVPWKRSDLGDIAGRPVNSLLDEVLQPLDRDVFQRENRYYDALKPDQGAPRAGTVQGSGDRP